MIKSIKIKAWRQFNNVNIDFHNRLTILTGANGAGKTTILNIINQHFGWDNELIGTPKRDKRTGALSYVSDLWKIIFSVKAPYLTDFNVIGELTYTDGAKTNILIPKNISSTYHIDFEIKHQLQGFNIPSHRPIYKYQNVPHIKTSAITKREAFRQYRNSQVERYSGNRSDKTETYFIKETLLSLATLGYGNEHVIANAESIRIYEGFVKILRTVLPPKLGFETLLIRSPEVVLKTKTGEFSIDAVSGGIASIIDLAWQIYMFDESDRQFIVSFDEPENHLHPEMQKTLLPNFLKAFPNVQFIIATHNPFIISSVIDSNVYALTYDIRNNVNSELLENIEKSGTANEILRQVLGIETTTPYWVDNKIEDLLKKYSKAGITSENIKSFKDDLASIGLERYVNQAAIELISKNNDRANEND